MRQQLSALIDDEADIAHAEHLFLAAKSTGEVAEAWRTYHVIRDVMREEVCMQSNMASRIMQALDDEPTVLAPSTTRPDDHNVTPFRPRLNRFSWSLAASVAAAFFVGLFVIKQQQPIEVVQIADNDANQYVTAHHNYAPNSATYYVQNVAYSGE